MRFRPSLLAVGSVLLVAASACSSSDEGESLPETAADAQPDAAASGDASHEPDASADAPGEPADESDASSEASDVDADLTDASSQDADAADDAPTDAADADAPADASPIDGSACDAVVEQHAIEGATHVAECSPVTYGTNPPSSGDHYAVWPAFRTYASPVPRGYYVHALEHGAIVITYNCPDGCASEVAEAQAMIDALPVDPLCPEGGSLKRRVILTPDPLLDVRWGASAWGFTLRAGCFEAPAFDAFARDHYAQSPEDICVDGHDFTLSDGGLAVEPGCGAGDGGSDDGGTVTDASME